MEISSAQLFEILSQFPPTPTHIPLKKDKSGESKFAEVGASEFKIPPTKTTSESNMEGNVEFSNRKISYSNFRTYSHLRELKKDVKELRKSKSLRPLNKRKSLPVSGEPLNIEPSNPIDKKLGRSIGSDTSYEASLAEDSPNDEPLLSLEEFAPSPKLSTYHKDLGKVSDLEMKFDDKNFEILLRACRSLTVTQKDQQDVFYMLTNFDQSEVVNALENVQKLVLESVSGTGKKSRFGKVINASKKREDCPLIKVSRHLIEFRVNGGPIPLNKEITEEINITSVNNYKARFKFLPGAPTKRYEITFLPKEGSIKKKLSQSVQVKLIAWSTVKINHAIVLEIEGGGRYYILIKAESEKSVFGVDVSELDTTLDLGLRIPTVLVTMKNYIKENGGLSHDSIFRLQGDENESKVVKDQLNRGTFVGCKDIHCVANLIKVWFRELPVHILNALPKELLSAASEEAREALKIFDHLEETNRSLMLWLLDLLASIASRESENSMNPRNLDNGDPGMLMLVVNTIQHLIIHQMHEMY